MQVKFEDLLTENDPIVGPPIVINLDSATKRWDDICDHFSQWGIKPIRFPAVNGIKLPAISPHMLESSASVSLNLSHAAVNRHCALFTQKLFWLILEDDCRFLENPRKSVVDLLTLASKNNLDWSLISLGCYSYDHQGLRPKIDYDGNWGIVNGLAGWYPWGSHSYLVNRKYCERIIERMSACFHPADHILIREFSNKGNGFLRRPSITYQEEYVSCRGGVAETKKSADLHPEIIKKITSTPLEIIQ